ncbi:MAG: 3-deoxy-D-manno-octulosonic acid transferase [Desulfomonile sp.]|nr:3-deoxy-D-manno-octulosonic acid transferase [Desulfomonile sp.]
MSGLLYNLVLHSVAAPALAVYYLPRIVFGGKYRRSLWGKLGCLPADFPAVPLRRPRLWFHAVSVGEVVALGPLVQAMRELVPAASIVVSTGTETGQDKAHQIIPDVDGRLYLPLDFPAFVNRVVERIEPDLFVLMETELWPNLIRCLKIRGAAIALANGRISDRSFPRYRSLRRFFSSTLDRIDLFLMSSELDADRIREMGAAESKILVTGNTKFDAALGDLPLDDERRMREVLGIPTHVPTLVAGSTHPGEHEVMLAAFNALKREFPDLVLVLVPRHVEKTPQIVAHMQALGMEPPFLRSALDQGETRNGRPVVIVDKTGELFRIYSVATLVYVGGSLVPRGGQNILEPAAWGKPVLFGPSMEDFRDAREMLLRSGAGFEVRNESELVAKAADILRDEDSARRLGEKGRTELMKHRGSAARNAQMLADLVRQMRISRTL